MKFEIPQQIFEKFSNIKFKENGSTSGILAVVCGETDREEDLHEDAKNRFSQLCERAETADRKSARSTANSLLRAPHTLS